MNTKLKAAAAALLSATLIGFGSPASAHHDKPGKHYIKPLYVPYTPMCESDEGENRTGKRCFWYAERMGNGKGRSFILYRFGEIRFISHHRAYRMWIAAESPR